MSLLNTLKQEIRENVPSGVERDEWRFTRYGMLTSAKEMTDSQMSIITEDLKQKALVSEGRDLKLPVTKIGNLVVSNVRSCTIGDFENESELVDVTWVTLAVSISMIKAQYQINEITYLSDLSKKLTLADNTLAKAIEDLIYAKLDADKSLVYNSPLVPAKYPLVGNAIQVAPAQQELFFNDLEAIMEGDDFYSMPFKVIGSTTLKPDVKHYANQGANNDENLDYQFDAYDFRFSNAVVIGAGQKSTGFCMTDGSLGILTRVNADALLGHTTTDGTEWSTTFMDTLGFEVGVQYKSTCDDLSAEPGLAHLQATMVERWELSLDVALLTPYNSDPATKPSVIKKFEFNS